MYYTDIYEADTTNGIGVRTVLWVSGCSHHCKNCHNPQTWNPKNGKKFTEETMKDLFMNKLSPDYIDGLTLSGGDPLYQDNLEDIFNICIKFRDLFGTNKTIWLYTGYTWEEIYFNEVSKTNQPILNSNLRKQIVGSCDVLVDGLFEEDKKDITLKWRGSSNQRVIDIKRTLINPNKEIQLYCD